MTREEALKTELAAIDCLDRFYWQAENPERHEKLGYLVRQDRRRELITELLRLMQSSPSWRRRARTGARQIEPSGSLARPQPSSWRSWGR